MIRFKPANDIEGQPKISDRQEQLLRELIALEYPQLNANELDYASNQALGHMDSFLTLCGTREYWTSKSWSSRPLNDEFTDLPISKQRKFQMRQRKRGLCSICADPVATTSKYYCEPHRIQRNEYQNGRRHVPWKTGKQPSAIILPLPGGTGE